MLIVFAGRPGVGKTTLAKYLAVKLQAVYLRVDTIEQALIDSGDIAKENMGGAGYFVAYAIAKENLKMRQTVIADSVNPITLTRTAWDQVAKESKVPIFNIEVICSDQAEHQNRVETRQVDIENLQLPSWQSVLDREYEHFNDVDLQIDTAYYTVEQAVDLIMSSISKIK